MISKTTNSYNYSKTCTTKDLVKESFTNLIIVNEGFKDYWYLDSKGFPTIGIGFEVNSFINKLKVCNETIKKEFGIFILTGDYLAKLDFNSFYNDYFKELSINDKMKYLNKLPKMEKITAEKWF